VSRSTDDGVSWGAPTPAHGSSTIDGGEDFDPTVTTDGAGVWFVAWDSTATAQHASGYGADRDLFTVRSADDGETWFAPASMNATYGKKDASADTGIALAGSRTGRFVGLYRGSSAEVQGVGADGDLVLLLGTMAYPCVDGNPDTVDVCAPSDGCEAMTKSDLCDDGNPCTSDAWAKGTGCTYEPIGGCTN
jgi:hypothetical protein